MLTRSKNKKIIKLAACLFIMSAAIFLLANFALAAEADVGLNYAAGTGLSNAPDIRVIIAKIIRIIIGFLGIMAVGLVIYAGWLWMTSEGSEEKVEQAKKLLQNAVIGLIIILSSFAIATFVLNKLAGAADGSLNGNNFAGGPGGGGISALGSGIINSHYPGRNQKEVPRNTKIIITFKEAMDPATIMVGDKINAPNIKIYKTKDGAAGAVAFEVKAAKTDDNKNFIFRPTQYLGSAAEKIYYSVALSRNLKKANGDAAFAGVVGETAYDWMFEVGTFIDNTPPKIESIIPRPGASEPRNVVVQINFSEAVDPVSASGASKNNFNNITVKDGATLVAGNFYLSNQYRTVEFLTEDKCGVNSCGNDVYCLPGGKTLAVLARAATLAVAGEPASNSTYDGIMDLASNSLDGNGNGAAQGSKSQSNLDPYNVNNPDVETQGDDYIWSFRTNNNLDTLAPEINRIAPSIQASGVNLNAPIEAEFSKLIMANSLNSDNAVLSGARNYWVSKTDGQATTTAYINHDQFNEGAGYKVEFKSGVKDIYQNCYAPCSGLGIAGITKSCCNGVASNQESCQ